MEEVVGSIPTRSTNPFDKLVALDLQLWRGRLLFSRRICAACILPRSDLNTIRVLVSLGLGYRDSGFKAHPLLCGAGEHAATGGVPRVGD
jgi:hypothetical protein